MKKRISSIMLAPIMPFSMAVPGFAAGSSNSADRLTAVTGKVKRSLALDTERYREFSGQLTEGELAATWRLSWSGEDGSLEITASESGKILSYYCYSADETRDSAPLSLPKSDPAKAKETAAAFLNRVLDSAEAVDLDAAADGTNSLRQTRYYFRGTVLLNGCPSPFSFSLSVRASDYAVVQFHRDSLETGYIGTVPAASFRLAQSITGPLLRDTLSLRLEYVLDDGEKTAVLRYLPNSIDSFYVDDADRKLVNLTKLYEELGKNNKFSSEDEAAEALRPLAAPAGVNGGLTQAEQLGADKLKGTLSKETLDQKAQSIPQLGLGSYTLASVSYQEEQVNSVPVIAAQLSYACRLERKTLRRRVTLNARTGELMGVCSSGLWNEDVDKKVSEDAARKTAEAFLTAQQGKRFALCAAYTGGAAADGENSRRGTWSFRYARQENGYFFPSDQFTIGIDAVDGSVSAYSQSWTEDVSFDSPDGIVSTGQAASAYFKTFQVTCGYAAVPRKLDLSDPKYAPLIEMGRRALSSLKLGWWLTAPGKNVTGIGAKTGQPVFWTGEESGSLQYSDLEGSWAKYAAETLADYGIGYAGGRFRPDKQLTQLDLVALLASTQGLLIDPDNLADGDAGQTYRTAYRMGALQRAERNDRQILSRIDVIKFLLDAGGYGSAAQLQGIYRTDFSDEAEIPENLLGYAALAQAISVAQGDSAGRLNPSQSATRGDAGVMLLAFMQRG